MRPLPSLSIAVKGVRMQLAWEGQAMYGLLKMDEVSLLSKVGCSDAYIEFCQL